MTALPVGTVTMLFTDIAGSTLLLRQLGERYGLALSAHRTILRSAFARWGGSELGTEGDSFFIAFGSARDALRACLESQRALAVHDWPDGVPVRVRMGVHVGEPIRHEDGYIGLDVHRAARISAAGHGGQVLVSEPVRQLTEGHLPLGVELRDLGWHWLKDLPGPERIHQLVAAGLAAEFPPLHSDGPRSNLPVESTPLVGREAELASLLRLLGRPDVRLVSLTGPGGMGKTRLAIAGASAFSVRTGCEVVFVDLAPVRDATLVQSAIADALGVKDVGGATAANLERRLQLRPVLLLLDNFEQVLPAGSVVARLLGASPDVLLLVTSRAALRLSGEHEFPVPALAVPDPHRPLTEVAESGSVRLFVQRATAVRPGFRLDATSTPTVAAICARLDGIPLAIELAAARVRTLSLSLLLERLSNPLAVLRGGRRDAPERQRTLRTTIDWSHDSLSGPEQVTFRHLAVFAGGFTLEAAEAVVRLATGEGEGEPDDGEVLETVSELVESSLVAQEERPDGELRQRLLEPLRDYALERLKASGELAAVRRRHAECFSGLTERAEPELRGAEQVWWLSRLDAEAANVDTALAWALETRCAGVGLRMGAALWRYWQLRGRLAGGRAVLERLLALPDAQDFPHALAGARACAGRLAFFQGDFSAAEFHLRAARDGFKRSADPFGEAFTTMNLGMVESGRGRHLTALELLEHSVELWRAVDDTWGLSLGLAYLGSAMVVDDEPRARSLLLEGLSLARQSGDMRTIALNLFSVGAFLAHADEPTEAAAHLEEAVRLQRQLGDAALAQTVDHLASLAQGRGDLDVAEQYLLEAVAVTGRIGDRDALRPPVRRLAALAMERGRSSEVAYLLGALTALGEPSVELEQLERTVRADLTAADFHRAWDEGASSSLDAMLGRTLARFRAP
jgi:predicted ATPase/class 3 adenylate cyclase